MFMSNNRYLNCVYGNKIEVGDLFVMHDRDGELYYCKLLSIDGKDVYVGIFQDTLEVGLPKYISFHYDLRHFYGLEQSGYTGELIKCIKIGNEVVINDTSYPVK